MAELNAVFEPLAEEQSVHALGVHLPRNRVVLEAVDPDDVDIAPYVSADVAEMVIVEGGVPPTTLDSASDAAGGGVQATTVVLVSSTGLLALLVGGLWYRCRRGSAA